LSAVQKKETPGGWWGQAWCLALLLLRQRPGAHLMWQALQSIARHRHPFVPWEGCLPPPSTAHSDPTRCVGHTGRRVLVAGGRGVSAWSPSSGGAALRPPRKGEERRRHARGVACTCGCGPGVVRAPAQRCCAFLGLLLRSGAVLPGTCGGLCGRNCRRGAVRAVIVAPAGSGSMEPMGSAQRLL
jgi:hypothetical protein